MNWPALGDETVDVLRRPLGIETTNPPGNEAEGARLLADLLAGDGVGSEIAESAPGRGNLVARVRVAVDDMRARARHYTEMLLDAAGA